MPKRILRGTVVSDKSDKTVVVSVDRKYKHSVYKKYIVRSKKYSAHDPQNVFKIGQNISIEEHSPISKTKKWHVVYEEVNK